MTISARVAADLVAVAGGEIIGRVRLQKLAYLLASKGCIKEALSFRYHHYGPYSRNLDDAIDIGKAFFGVREDIQYRKSDGMPFSIFRCSASAQESSAIDVQSARLLLKKLKDQPSTVLELAATIHWLREQEGVEDWRSELKRRKGAKTGNGRLEQAAALLAELGMQPA